MGIMDRESLEAKILEVLKSGEWTETLRVAQAVGRTNKRDVNPALYGLESKGRVVKESVSSKPRWKIADGAMCEKSKVQPVELALASGPTSSPPPEPPAATGTGTAALPETKTTAAEASGPTSSPPPEPPPAATGMGTVAISETKTAAELPSHTASPSGYAGERSQVAEANPSTPDVPPELSANWNPKGQLLEMFGEHAVKPKLVPETKFQYELQVALVSKPFQGPLEARKATAERRVFEMALAYFKEHPDLVPQEAPDIDFKSRLQIFADTKQISCKYDTKKSDAGGFESTVSATRAGAASPLLELSRRGRKKMDAEKLAAQAALEELESQVKASPVPERPAAPATAAVSGGTAVPKATPALTEEQKQMQIEAFREQCEEHDKLKDLLEPHQLPNFEKVRVQMSSCIKEAYRLKLIDQQEKKRLEAINGRGNCAKHMPERLRPKVDAEATAAASAEGSLPEDSALPCAPKSVEVAFEIVD